MTIELTATINSDVEEILSFRCCNMHGLNLELLIKNKGNLPIEIENHFILWSEKTSLRCENLYPPQPRKVGPCELVTFYTSMDERIWEQYQALSVYDTMGNEYRFPINA